MTHLMLKLFLALIRHIYDDAYSLRWLMKGSEWCYFDRQFYITIQHFKSITSFKSEKMRFYL